MSFFKIKRRPSDILWTKYIRERDKNICFWCGRLCDNPLNSGVSHYHNRNKENTRFDDENCDLMHNIPCHTEAEHKKQIKGFKDAKEDGEYTLRKKKQLGQSGFDELFLRASLRKKRDDVMDKLIIKTKMATDKAIDQYGPVLKKLGKN